LILTLPFKEQHIPEKEPGFSRIIHWVYFARNKNLYFFIMNCFDMRMRIGGMPL
jgi:hypothetical protein